IREYPLIFPYGLVFNTRRPPFDDPRARLAAALAIDRQEIVDGYLFGLATPAEGPVPPGLPGYVAPPHIPFDPDSARRLVAPISTREYPLIFPYGLVFNTRRPPFDDPRARLAAALAIDRQEIVDGYLFGLATPAEGPVPPGLPGYVAPPHIPFDPDSARRLVA